MMVSPSVAFSIGYFPEAKLYMGILFEIINVSICHYFCNKYFTFRQSQWPWDGEKCVCPLEKKDGMI